MNIKYFLAIMAGFFAGIVLALPAASTVDSLEQTSAFEETNLKSRGQPYKMECTVNWYYKRTAADCLGAYGTHCSSMGDLLNQAPDPIVKTHFTKAYPCQYLQCYCVYDNEVSIMGWDDGYGKGWEVTGESGMGSSGARRQVEQEVGLIGAQILNGQPNHPEAGAGKREEAGSDTHTGLNPFAGHPDHPHPTTVSTKQLHKPLTAISDAAKWQLTRSLHPAHAPRPTMFSPIFPRIIPTQPLAPLPTLENEPRTHSI